MDLATGLSEESQLQAQVLRVGAGQGVEPPSRSHVEPAVPGLSGAM